VPRGRKPLHVTHRGDERRRGQDVVHSSLPRRPAAPAPGRSPRGGWPTGRRVPVGSRAAPSPCLVTGLAQFQVERPARGVRLGVGVVDHVHRGFDRARGECRSEGACRQNEIGGPAARPKGDWGLHRIASVRVAVLDRRLRR
jgi:hypothetical protein